MKKKKNIFIVSSTGTNTGKTYVAKNLVKIFRKKNISINVYKPIISGVNSKNILKSDSALLLKELNSKFSMQAFNKISPWSFSKPLAPTLAAQKEGKKIIYSEISEWLNKEIKKTSSDFILIEGAGGLMVPIDKKKTFINLVEEFRMAIILVVGNYLGTISHTLSLVKNIEALNLDIINIVLNEGKKKDININDTENLLKENISEKYKIRKIIKNYNENDNNFKKIFEDIINYYN